MSPPQTSNKLMQRPTRKRSSQPAFLPRQRRSRCSLPSRTAAYPPPQVSASFGATSTGAGPTPSAPSPSSVPPSRCTLALIRSTIAGTRSLPSRRTAGRPPLSSKGRRTRSSGTRPRDHLGGRWSRKLSGLCRSGERSQNLCPRLALSFLRPGTLKSTLQLQCKLES